MSNEYYVISLKHTSKGDTALTFWCADGNGYTWHRDRAGVYTEEEALKCVSNDNVMVKKEIVDPYWMNAVDFRDKYISVPNHPGVLFNFGIYEQAKKMMKPKKFAGCRMVFQNTPVTTTP